MQIDFFIIYYIKGAENVNLSGISNSKWFPIDLQLINDVGFNLISLNKQFEHLIYELF